MTQTPSPQPPADRPWTGRVFVGVSLDGFIARTDGDIGWLTDPPPGREHTTVTSSVPGEIWETYFPTIDHLLMGRRTYDTIATIQPWLYGSTPVVVVSTTLPVDDPRVAVVGSVVEAKRLLTERGARQVYVDGGQLIQSFLRAGLIEEITTCWAPVLIGSGRRLFGELDADVLLTLRGCHVSETGMVHATYRVDHS